MARSRDRVQRILEFSDRHNFQVIGWTGLAVGLIYGICAWVWMQPPNGSIGHLLFDVFVWGGVAALIAMVVLAITIVFLARILEASTRSRRRKNQPIR
jgi:heme/copper-type cytochrome/quinol oxidase subunit 2